VRCETNRPSGPMGPDGPSGGTWKYVKAPSTKKLGEIVYLLICSFLPCLSWLLRSRVRKSRRDLRITLYRSAETLFVKLSSCKEEVFRQKPFLSFSQFSYKNTPTVPFFMTFDYEDDSRRNVLII